MLSKRKFYWKIKYKIKLPLLHQLALLILFRFPIFLILFDETNSQFIVMFKSCLLHSVLYKKISQKSNLILPLLFFFFFSEIFPMTLSKNQNQDCQAVTQPFHSPAAALSLDSLHPHHCPQLTHFTKAGVSLFTGKIRPFN